MYGDIMKKTIGEIIEIQNVLQTIKQLPLDFARFRQLRKLLPVIEAEFVIYLDKERELLAKYNFKENKFASKLDETEYIREIMVIRNEIVEINVEPITIKELEMTGISISYNAMEAIKDIVNIAMDGEELEENQL